MSISKFWAFPFLLFFSGCTHLFYQPTDLMYVRDPKQLDSLREEVSFKSSDGTQLAGWFFKARAGKHKGAVVQFHGNAENMTSHFASLYWLMDEGYDFFTFDYRGYGISDGKPSQEGVNRDALAAIQYILKREPASADGKPDIVLYGQSLGSAILLRAYDDVGPQDRARVKALVVESGFYNYKAIASDVLSRTWITYILQPLGYVLVSNEYSPEESIARVSPTPILVIHGDQDRVVPMRFGKKIYDLAKEPKQFMLISGGAHINSMFVNKGEYRAKLLSYLDAPSGDQSPTKTPALTWKSPNAPLDNLTTP
jgi:fermentation-respiration switch protein FrsA (DUF1100 family)